MEATATTRVPPVPAPVQLARALLAAVAVSHLVVPVVMWARQGELRNEIAAQHPGFGAAEVSRSADIAVTSGAVFHGVLLALCALLVWKLATARLWTRRLTTASQVLSIVFSAFSWTSSPMFHVVIPIIGAAQILLLALLWAPRPA
ncbi:hypothetical protein [Sphaerisporangium corydalis]|uniref:DUF4345 domain-containing protein n=1 Tax=Sphaerisporangium corydalis TaxID=1441875 RepID=A0ABV9E651_9ACTN|nr:hypothetical protein [Sphaerisporangium corydalis]